MLLMPHNPNVVRGRVLKDQLWLGAGGCEDNVLYLFGIGNAGKSSNFVEQAVSYYFISIIV